MLPSCCSTVVHLGASLMFQKSQCGGLLPPCLTLSVLASVAPLTPGCTTRRLGLTVPICLTDCLLHEENFSVRCPKHKVSQCTWPPQAWGGGVPHGLQTIHRRPPPALGPERVERPGAGGSPAPQGGPHVLWWESGRTVGERKVFVDC